MLSSSMRHRLRVVFAFLTLLPLPLFMMIYLPSYLGKPVPHVAHVSWQNCPDHEVYVAWETETAEIGLVRFGLSPDQLVNESVDAVATQFHAVNLTDLTPDTKYYYEVISHGEVYTTGEFRTAPFSFIPFSIGLTADTQPKYGPGWHSTMAKTFGKKDYAFIAMVGDIAEDGIKDEWNDYFTRAGEWMDTIPIVPVQGNHDRPRDGTYYFGQYFPQTEDLITGTNEFDTNKQFYYSFNWSNVHFQILHFPQVDLDDEGEPDLVSKSDYYEAFTPDQLAWIRADLEDAQLLPYRVTLFHCPITGAGFYGPNYILMNELLPILHEYNVTITVHGHAHHYERGILPNPIHPGNDLTYLVVGTGGGLADVGLRPVEQTVTCTASPCYTELHVTSEGILIQAWTLSGELVDETLISA